MQLIYNTSKKIKVAKSVTIARFLLGTKMMLVVGVRWGENSVNQMPPEN